MPGIFVDPNSTFPITLFYRDVTDDAGNEVTTDVWVGEDGESPDGDGWRSLTARFRQVDQGSFGEVLEEATIINHVNQRPTLRTKMLREQVLLRYMVSWDVGPDGHGGWPEDGAIQINYQTLFGAKWRIANKIFIEYMVRSNMMDAVRKAVDDEGGPTQPLLAAAVWDGEGPPQVQPFPGFPPMSGFPER